MDEFDSLKAGVVLRMYMEFVSKRAKPLDSVMLDLLHGAVGVSGEAGELLDSVKKSWIYNKPLDRDNIREECGDILFYIQTICNTIGTDIITLLEGNMVKLKVRYPEKYSDANAQARADKAG